MEVEEADGILTSPDLLLSDGSLRDGPCGEREREDKSSAEAKPPETSVQHQERHLLTHWTSVPAAEAGEGQENQGDQDSDWHKHQRPSSSIHDLPVDNRERLRAIPGVLADATLHHHGSEPSCWFQPCSLYTSLFFLLRDLRLFLFEGPQTRSVRSTSHSS